MTLSRHTTLMRVVDISAVCSAVLTPHYVNALARPVHISDFGEKVGISINGLSILATLSFAIKVLFG